jgi:phycobilisome core-membrane linker protein
VKSEFTVFESKLSNGEITVKEFIEGLGCSTLYIKEFYAPYPNTQVIEFGTKHFLGRAPLDQAEIRKYNQILATEGIRGFIRAMLNTSEYAECFGEDTIPYRRFPTLPAANFPNTEKLYNRLTKQNRDVVVPSFEPAKSTIDVTIMPLMADAIATQSAESAELVGSLGRASETEAAAIAIGQSVTRLYRLTPGSTQAEVEEVLTAAYRQVFDLSDPVIPTDWRLVSLEADLGRGQMTVRQFVRAIVASNRSYQRFCAAYPAPKVVDMMVRHLLGRAVASEDERQRYLTILNDQGSMVLADELLHSAEYLRYFGENGVPYRRNC